MGSKYSIHESMGNTWNSNNNITTLQVSHLCILSGFHSSSVSFLAPSISALITLCFLLFPLPWIWRRETLVYGKSQLWQKTLWEMYWSKEEKLWFYNIYPNSWTSKYVCSFIQVFTSEGLIFILPKLFTTVISILLFVMLWKLINLKLLLNHCPQVSSKYAWCYIYIYMHICIHIHLFYEYSNVLLYSIFSK